SAFARLHVQLSKSERALEVRMSELEAAERHIALLEGKLLKVKQYRSELKLLKEQKRALLKSPERKIGQVLLAPYRFPERLVKIVWKKLFRQSASEDTPASSQYHRWLLHHRAHVHDFEAM